jgi:hypothetical protein
MSNLYKHFTGKEPEDIDVSLDSLDFYIQSETWGWDDDNWDARSLSHGGELDFVPDENGAYRAVLRYED